MRLFYHFSVDNFSNTYLLGPREGGDALIIDPGIFDETLLNMIEDNNYDLKYILVTRASNAHLRGLSTIKKIYDAQIYAGIPQIKSFNINVLQPDSTIELGELQVEVLPFKELSQDSLIYKIGTMGIFAPMSSVRAKPVGRKTPIRLPTSRRPWKSVF
jgi:hydroxyacylglutathione hydrolase